MRNNTRLTIIIIFLALPFLSGGVFGEQFTDKVKKPVDDSITIRQKSQKEVEKWAGEKRRLEAEYESLLESRKRLTAIRDRLVEEVESGEKTVDSLEKRIMALEKISEKLMPFLKGVKSQLGRLMEERPRFLIEERSVRSDSLEKTLDDPKIAPGEKFRKVMEALFIEAEYGNTVEVYQEKIRLEDDKVLVNVFRLGRMALFFETLDQKTVGYLDMATGKWRGLPQDANLGIRTAMEIGSKRRPADIVTLPLGRIEVK